jgi:hypothetical protein
MVDAEEDSWARHAAPVGKRADARDSTECARPGAVEARFIEWLAPWML